MLEQEEEAARKAQEDRKRAAELADAEMARKFQEQEQEAIKRQRDMALQDAQIAARLLEEEKRAIEREKEKRDWEATMNLIKQEATSEVEQELARVREEKRRLEERLQEAGKPAPIAISLAECEYPDAWDVINQKSNQLILDVPQHSAEWKTVVKEFHSGMPQAKVTRIQRNQNKSIWMWFWLKRKEIQQKKWMGWCK